MTNLNKMFWNIYTTKEKSCNYC